MNRPQVLLAEDHAEDVAEVLKRILNDEFDVVGAVADGVALIEAADRLKPDVIVADISMPRLRRFERVDQNEEETTRRESRLDHDV